MFINWLRIGVATLLLFALGKNPYSYYVLLRIIVFGLSIYCVYLLYNSKTKNWMFIYIILAFVFNPIIPVYLDRDIWAIIDVASAIIIIVSIFYFPSESQIIKNLFKKV